MVVLGMTLAMRVNSHIPRTVLHLSGALGFFGAEQVIATLARHADRLQWHPVVACLLDPRCEESDMLRAVRSCGIETAEFHLRGRYDPQGIRELHAFLSQRRVSVLHCHGYKSDGYGLLAACGLPIARICTVHGWTSQTLALRVYEAADKWVFLRGYHRLIAVSGPIKRELLRCGYPASKIAVVPNGVDLSRFPLRQVRSDGPLPIPFDREIIGSVGRLSGEKGQAYLLLAAVRILRERPRAILVLVGEGRAESALRAQAAGLGIADRVLFVGLRRDVPQLLPQFDVFVLPSLREGLPMAALEAMAVGVPVVATAVGDVPRLVTAGETGFLVPPADPDALAVAILRTLADPQSSGRRACAARALVERDYSAHAMAARTEAVYLHALRMLGLG